jgi:hypothetical protein
MQSPTSKEPREVPVILLDQNLSSRKISEPLKKFSDWHIELHSDHFASNAPDVDWIPVCGEKKWVIITCDKRIARVPQNVQAVISSNAVVFMFGKGGRRAEEYSAALIHHRLKILRMIKNTAAPFFARISLGGDVSLVGEIEGLMTVSKTDLKYKSGASIPPHLAHPTVGEDRRND